MDKVFLNNPFLFYTYFSNLKYISSILTPSSTFTSLVIPHLLNPIFSTLCKDLTLLENTTAVKVFKPTSLKAYSIILFNSSVP